MDSYGLDYTLFPIIVMGFFGSFVITMMAGFKLVLDGDPKIHRPLRVFITWCIAFWTMILTGIWLMIKWGNIGCL